MSLSGGTRLGPYEVVDLLGAGGMGSVYRARDTRLGRDVALKVVRADGAQGPERLRRFETEARAVARLSHPNVLSVFDVGTHEGQPYLVLELLEGETLRQRLCRGPLPASEAAELARQACAGLQAAHARGIVHRDLKPENLFLTSEGLLKILDFGVAKLKSGDGAGKDGGHADRGRASARDDRVPVSGAGAGNGSRRALGRVRAGCRAVRGPERAACVRAAERGGDSGGDPERRPAAPGDGVGAAARGAREDRAALPPEGAGAALPVGARPGPGARGGDDGEGGRPGSGGGDGRAVPGAALVHGDGGAAVLRSRARGRRRCGRSWAGGGCWR